MLTRLRLDNYRCFDAFDQTLGGYLVLVGPNGSGKSTLLDSLVLLGDLAGPQTCSEVFLGATRGEGAPRAQALLELLHRGQGTQFTLEVEALAPSKLDLPPAAADEVVDRNAQPGRELLYQLTFELQPPDRLIIANELLIVLPVEGYDQGGGLLSSNSSPAAGTGPPSSARSPMEPAATLPTRSSGSNCRRIERRSPTCRQTIAFSPLPSGSGTT